MFFGLGKKKKDDIKQIKSAIDAEGGLFDPGDFEGLPYSEELPGQTPPKDLPLTKEPPESPIKSAKNLPMPMPELSRPPEIKPLHEEVTIPEPKTGPSAPLFVKIDKYREVLISIKKMRLVVANIESIIDMKKHLDKVKGEADTLLDKNMDKFSQMLEELNRDMKRPQSMEPNISAEKEEAQKVGEYVKDLEGEINKLKNQIKKI